MNHRPRKRFGQNFLHDQTIISALIAAIAPRREDHLVEIGPGRGALTRPLAASGGRLDLIELDRDLVPRLRWEFNSAPIRIFNADALRFDFSTLPENTEKLRIVGNLPYNISTPLIFHLLQQLPIIADMHFMLQKEVVERLCAEAGGKQYGRLTVMAGYFCHCQKLFEVAPECFDPVPKVTSAIVRLTPRPPPLPATNLKTLENVVAQGFSQRRKTLRNALRKLITASEMETLEIIPGARPETLDLTQWIRLSNYIAAQADGTEDSRD